MDELLLCNDIDLKCLNSTKIEDFDSGCSSAPSSPSNFSDFSGSSCEEFNDDLMLTRRDVVEMGQSLLNGGPVINPYIKIKTDEDLDDFCTAADCLLPANDDLLGMMLNGVEVFREDSYTFDDKDTINAKVVVEQLEPIEIKNYMDLDKQPAPSANFKSSRKITRRNRNSSCCSSDHCYAREQEQADDTDDSTAPSKGDSYIEKRRKNNLAAKKSRQLKRAKEIGNLKKYETLSKENKSLQKEMKKLQSLVLKLEAKLNH